MNALGGWAARGIDAALEVGIAPSFTNIGPAVRSRVAGWEPVSTDLSGRVVLLTGASSGLGRSSALALASLGADLILVGRDADRLEAVRAACATAARSEDQRIEILRADLTRLAEAHKVVDVVVAEFARLDVIIHNAGALVAHYQRTEEGFEATYAAQVLAQHVITAGLLPLLAVTPGSRVIVVASGGMYSERLDPTQVEMAEPDFDGVTAYARAKRAQVALTEQWARRFADSGVTFHSMHPGWADTPGVAQSLPTFRRITGPFLRTPEQGADTIVWLAAADEPLAANGRFWLDRRPRSTVRLPWTRPAASAADELWDQVCAQSGTIPALSASG